MFGIGRLYHLTQVVDDVDAADTWYTRVFDARRIYRGYDAVAMRVASIIVIGNAVIELIEVDRSPDAERTPLGRYHAKFGQHLHSIAMFVDSLGDAGEALHDAGVRMTDTPGRPITDVRPDRTIWTHPKDTIMVLELAVVPRFHFDPRLHPSWTDDYWRSGPLGLTSLPHVTVLVADSERGRYVFGEVLQRQQVASEPWVGGGLRRVYDFGPDLQVELVTPTEPGSPEQLDLARLGDGPFGYCFGVADLGAAERHLELLGQPVARRGSDQLIIPPEHGHGTAISFVEA